MWNKFFNKNIYKAEKTNIEEYEEPMRRWREVLGGRRCKKFVRCTSDCFSDLIAELRNNPNCCYDTYMNDVIRSGYDPKFLSVLMRNTDVNKDDDSTEMSNLFKEVYASRILNFFECPTAYDTLISLDGKIYSCSVDFVRENEEFYILDDILQIDFLPQKLKDFVSAFTNYDKSHKFNPNLEPDIQSTIENLVYSELIRWYMCGDMDYQYHNMGVLYNNKNNTIRMAPNFDFDQFFRYYNFDFTNKTTGNNLSKKLINYLEEIKYQYPTVCEKFTTKLNLFTTKKDGKYPYEDLIKDELKNSTYLREFTRDFGNRIKSLKDSINEKSMTT